MRILKLPDFRERLEGLGMEPVGDTSDQFAQYIRSEIVKYKKIVEQSGARVD